jgi:hypothetical protein
MLEQRVSQTQEGESELLGGPIEPGISSRIALQDCLFLSLIVSLSLVLYIKGLGLYSDDWHFLGLLSNSSDQSLFGLLRIVIPDTRLRPIESLYVAGLYWLFGFRPLAYHLINAVVFTATILFFYLSIRKLIKARVLAIAIPLVYAMLPHYSSNRFWFIAFVINLSIGFYFLSLFSDLTAQEMRERHRWKWKLLGTIAMLCSAFSYEVVLPLFLLNPFFVWLRARQLNEPGFNKRSARKALMVSLAINVLAIMAVGIYKIVTARGEPDLFVHRMGIRESYSSHLFRLAVGAIGVNYGSYGIALPLKIGRALRYYSIPSILAVSTLIGLFVFVYLYRSNRSQDDSFSREESYFRLMAVGLVVFLLGYAVFLTNAQVGFTTTGVMNRTAIAAALGVAISFVSLIGWISWTLPSIRSRRFALSLLISLLCAGGFLINNTIAVFWIAASRQQQEIIAAVREEFSLLPSDTTLILDGLCPYRGPGIVFECYWDVSGMLKTYYHDTSLRGDIVKRNMTIDEDGLRTSIYGEKRFYPYSDKLLLFHIGRSETYHLIDADSARGYFQVIDPDYTNICPEGDEGYGTSIF